MRYLEPRLGDPLVTPEQQIEVDGSRAPPWPDPLTPEATLDIEQIRQECARLEWRLHLSSRVHKQRLVVEAPGLGLEERRQAGRPDQRGCPANRRLTVAHVRPETDVGKCHGRSTVTALKSTVIPAGFTCGLRTQTFTRS